MEILILVQIRNGHNTAGAHETAATTSEPGSYPTPVRFFTSVNTSLAVTSGSRSYFSVNCNCTSRSTNRHSEYNKHANAK